ncbi:MAG: methylenetetrahydrofolate reductase [Bifidobacteriaceae bacterium]|jgi:methylenetetrahydrofolate reductase (NADPH)|nr:methylenetetrahydrofolate reductase [Bifidobacteriaceae bacterium]
MHLAHRVVAAIGGPHPSVSFEFYPPRGPQGEAALMRHLDALEEVAPDFVSVTYGAGGSVADRSAASVRVSRAICAKAGPALMAHLTVVGHTREELETIIGELTAAGADAMLALRGDPPGGPRAPWTPAPGGFGHAADLVQVMRAAGCDVGVAAFAHKHPASVDTAQDLRALAAKEEAGAAFAITQMVFDAQPYADLVARARAAGIGLPIVPGIMPVSSADQVPRLEGFCGAPLPATLVAALRRGEGDRAAEAEVGAAWAVDTVRDLLQAGAPGIHLYTLNRSRLALEVCRRVGLRGAALLEAGCDPPLGITTHPQSVKVR